MPIEFDCPYCKAMIRVPDNAGGGKGRCPKCATRITVPKKSPKKTVVKPVADEEPFILPLADESSENEQIATTPPEVSPPTLGEASLPFDPAVLTKPRLGELPVERSASPASVTQRLKKKQRQNGPWVIALIVAGLGIVGVGYFVFPQVLTERLSDNLVAQSATTLELPPVIIERSRFRLSPEDVSRLLTKLEQNPVPLNSNSMSIQMAGSEKGLTISLAGGSSSKFYRVRLTDSEPIQKYLNRHGAELEQARSKRIDEAANEFLIAYEKVLAKKASSDSITPFRDSLALTALSRGLGQELVAEYGRGLYRCAYQDAEDSLYFLLPPDVSEFKIVGFKHSDGTVAVPAELRVTVKGQIASEKNRQQEKHSNPTTDKEVDSRPDEEISGEPKNVPK